MSFTKEKIRITLENIRSLTEVQRLPIEDAQIIPCGYKENDNTPPAPDADWVPLDRSVPFSGVDGHYWIHATLRTPDIAEDEIVFLRLTTGKEGQWDARNPQGLLYLDGRMIQGLDVNHTEVRLQGGETHDMYLYFYSGMDEAPFHIHMDVSVRNVYAFNLLFDMEIPFEAALLFDPSSNEYLNIMKYLDIAANYLDFRNGKSPEFYASAKAASEYLYREFYNGVCGRDDSVEVTMIGHTHIDVAWLWTLAQTKEKAQRSFATVINLMRQYPEYVFMSSQPQLFQYVKEAAPELYQQVKDAVAAGRFEVDGAMWLEADCNLTSGESLVRQIVHGKRFMQEEFGVDSRILWLPDVFGYSAALPQILKKSGVDKLVTSKISWNETNKLPYDVFNWEGIDGTEIFTYFLTAQDYDRREEKTITTYVGMVTPAQVKGSWERFQQKEYTNKAIVTYGYGDGGGGPTYQMLESQRRLAYGIPGIPKTRMQKAGDFLNQVEADFYKNAGEMKRLPKWVGELYLEMHRGTYTSIAKNKKNNRKSEFLYQKAEALSVLDKVLLNGSYDKKTLYDGWEKICLMQFHDIIPGSSIFEVYEDTDKLYADILAKAGRIEGEKLRAIAANVPDTEGTLVYNPTSFAFSGVVDSENGSIYAEDVPAYGWKVIHGENVPAGLLSASETVIENDLLRVTLDEKAQIVSVFDKEANRELIQAGEKANQLQVFEDYPRDYDAWEITDYYKEKMWIADGLTGLSIIREPLRAGVKVVRSYNHSVISQEITLAPHSRRIDFKTEVDWKEDHVLLKAAFPLNLHTSRASYDIQFGNLERPTHANTSWDAAKFEVVGQKWADLSEGDYGVSLINDCKYGYSAEGSVLKLSLLKAATYPNIHADRHLHSFTYSLYPHAGDFRTGGTYMEIYRLNQPVSAVSLSGEKAASPSLPSTYSFASVSSPNLILDTVKESDDGEDVILRLYEAHNTQGTARIQLGFEPKAVSLCNLLEEKLQPVSFDGSTVTLPYSNFEIITLRIER